MSNLESQTTENQANAAHDDIDDDDDQTFSSHKIVTDTHQSTKTNASNTIKTDVKSLLSTLIPKDYSGFVQCHIKREKDGLSKKFSLYFDGLNENDQTFLLIARKHLSITGHSEYYIGTNPENPSKNLNEENCLAKLKGINIKGTEYILYDQQNSSNKDNQSAAIIYDDHILGSKEPRKLIILLRDNANNSQPLKDNETIVSEWQVGRLNNFTELRNTPPVFNEEKKVYTLNLRDNRVKQPSHKNFQLVATNGDPESNVAMQFGRIDDNTFALDYRYPLTAVQAFAIALSSYHNRFRT